MPITLWLLGYAGFQVLNNFGAIAGIVVTVAVIASMSSIGFLVDLNGIRTKAMLGQIEKAYGIDLSAWKHDTN